jgi:hypothetical protein
MAYSIAVASYDNQQGQRKSEGGRGQKRERHNSRSYSALAFTVGHATLLRLLLSGLVVH